MGRTTVCTLLFVCLLAALSASAAAATTTAKLTGVEIGATSTHGTFLGNGHAGTGAKVAWTASVRHTPIKRGSAEITGGTFAMGTLKGTHSANAFAGKFVGGTVRLTDSSPGCGDQHFAVRGRLANVVTPSAKGGSGTMSIRLTHYRRSVLGRCVTYGASVVGTVSIAA